MFVKKVSQPTRHQGFGEILERGTLKDLYVGPSSGGGEGRLAPSSVDGEISVLNSHLKTVRRLGSRSSKDRGETSFNCETTFEIICRPC